MKCSFGINIPFGTVRDSQPANGEGMRNPVAVIQFFSLISALFGFLHLYCNWTDGFVVILSLEVGCPV